MENKSSIPQIFFTDKAHNKLLSIAKKTYKREIGGLILGTACNYETGRALVITKVSGPGKNSDLYENGFRPDIDYYKKIREKYSSLLYFGEWHKHPHGVFNFSKQDLEQTLEIMRTEGIKEFICPICTPVAVDSGVKKFQIRCFYINTQFETFIPVDYSIISDPFDQRKPLKYVAIEGNIIYKFICSCKPYSITDGDLYPAHGVAHLYSNTSHSNCRFILINSKRCSELPIVQGINIVISITSKKGKIPDVKAYEIKNNKQYKIKAELIFPKSDIFSRNKGLLETKVLQNKHVAIIGTGSIGSVAAMELARAGVGSFTLIDPDKLSIHNLSRHLCDLSQLGMYKVDAVKLRIRKVLPYARLFPYHENSNKNPQITLDRCKKADILLVTTDTENSRKLANWIAYELGIVVIFAGLLERAIGGRVWRILPHKGACYECYPATQQILEPNSISYSEAKSPRDLTIQPGLGNDIAFVTHLAVRYVIETLTDSKQLKYSIIFWFNYPYKDWKNEPLTLYKAKELSKNPDCTFCNSNGSKKIENSEKSKK